MMYFSLRKKFLLPFFTLPNDDVVTVWRWWRISIPIVWTKEIMLAEAGLHEKRTKDRCEEDDDKLFHKASVFNCWWIKFEFSENVRPSCGFLFLVQRYGLFIRHARSFFLKRKEKCLWALGFSLFRFFCSFCPRTHAFIRIKGLFLLNSVNKGGQKYVSVLLFS